MAKSSGLFIKTVESWLDGRPQAWLVEKTGITKSRVSRLLGGKGEPDLEEVIKIANAFGRKGYELVAILESMPPTLTEIFGVLAALDDSELESALSAISAIRNASARRKATQEKKGAG